MTAKAVSELTVKEKIEYHEKIEKIKNMIFDLEMSLREGQDARYDLFKLRCDFARIQDWYFTKGP